MRRAGAGTGAGTEARFRPARLVVRMEVGHGKICGKGSASFCSKRAKVIDGSVFVANDGIEPVELGLGSADGPLFRGQDGLETSHLLLEKRVDKGRVGSLGMAGKHGGPEVLEPRHGFGQCRFGGGDGRGAR